MKVLDVQEVIDAIDQIKEAKQRDSENIETLRASIQKIQHLESLQGEGGDAIKDHFARLHVPVLEAFHLVIRQYIEQLDIIRSNLLGFESSSAIVREEFLTNDIKNGLDRIETTATADATEIESIRTSISDILSLPTFSMETVLGHVDRGKDHAAETVEKLHALDEENEALLEQAESTLQEVTTVVNQVANWSSGGAILSADTLAEIDAKLESLYSNLVTEAIHMEPDTYTIDQNGQVISSYQNALPLEFLTTGAYANIPGGLKAMSWYYMNHLPVSAMVNDEQAIQACLAPGMEGHTVATSRYQQAINLFAIQNGLSNETTVSLVQLNQQMHRLFPVQYEWMQAQLYTEMNSGSYQAPPVQSGVDEWSNVNAFNDGVSGNQVKAGGDHDFTDDEVAGIQEYLKNGGSSTNNVEMTDEEAYAGLTNDVRVGHRADGQSYQSNINMFMPAAEFVFGDFVTLIDANASGLDKAMAATFILVKPVKVAEMGYDLARVRKVDGGGGKSATSAVRTNDKSSGLLDELSKSGVKYNPDDVLAVTKTVSGKVVWLEKGNSRAGLQHVMNHANDFARRGIKSEDIPNLLMEALNKGKVVGHQGRGTGRPIYEVVYNGQKQRVAITVGNNGFIVGANPAALP